MDLKELDSISFTPEQFDSVNLKLRILEVTALNVIQEQLAELLALQSAGGNDSVIKRFAKRSREIQVSLQAYLIKKS